MHTMSPASYAPPPALLNGARRLGAPGAAYVPEFLCRERADAALARVLQETDWQRERVRMFGHVHDAPRLTAWYGDAGAVYRYSGVVREAAPWPPVHRALAQEVAAAVASRFNFVLVNRYRNGDDMLGWHSDDEADLGAAPVIAALSLGAPRMFRIRPRRGGASVGQVLGHGSLLLMWGSCQRDAKHCLPRSRRCTAERVNLSFRLTRTS